MNPAMGPDQEILDIVAVISGTLPKLNGQQNYCIWRSKLWEELRTLPPKHVQLLAGNYTVPEPLLYHDLSDEAVRELLLAQKGVDPDSITPKLISTKANQLKAVNFILERKYKFAKAEWEFTNDAVNDIIKFGIDSALLHQISLEDNAYETFQALESRYGQSSFLPIFMRFQKLHNLRYDGENAAQFVRDFQEALGGYVELAGDIDITEELCFFLSAIAGNASCYAFIQGLKVDLSAESMGQIYDDFVQSGNSDEPCEPHRGLSPTCTTTSKDKHGKKRKRKQQDE